MVYYMVYDITLYHTIIFTIAIAHSKHKLYGT